MEVIGRRGFWTAVGPEIDAIGHKWEGFCLESYRQDRYMRDGTQDFHMTIGPMDADEQGPLNRAPSRVVDLGMARYSNAPYDVVYVVVMSPDDKRLFHITLGLRGSDYHGNDKYNLGKWMVRWNTLLVVQDMEKHHLRALRAFFSSGSMSADQTIDYVYAECKNAFKAKDWAALARWLHFPNTAVLNAENLEDRHDAAKLVMEYCLTWETSWHRSPELLREAVVHSQRHGRSLDDRIRSFLQREWNTYFVGNNCDEDGSRNRDDVLVELPLHKQLSFHELPRFFSWVIPQFLAGMSLPRSSSDLQALYTLGIRRVLTIMEDALPQETRIPPMEYLHVPCANYGAPAAQVLQASVRWILSSTAPCVVHCGGGKGRTGLLLAAVLSHTGFSAASDALTSPNAPILSSQDAIEGIRRLRPGSIETAVQENAVRQYTRAAHQLITTADQEDAQGSEMKKKKKKAMVLRGKQPIIILCGLPGSGKSTISTILSNHFENVAVICQDDLEKGRSTQAEIQAVVHDSKTMVVVDRCNVTVRDRAQIAEWGGSREKILVVMDTLLNVCIERASRRMGHPTLDSSRAESVIRMLNRKFERPSVSEGSVFASIHTVQTDGELSSFLFEQFGVDWAAPMQDGISSDAPLSKFPRTPHILSLGSATRDDLIMSESPERMFGDVTGRVIVEEKIDGANLGISLSAEYKVICQNRSHFVNSESHPQFRELEKWISRHEGELCRILEPGRHVLYGEWMAATHKVHYDALPDLFVAFDIFDRLHGKFFSRRALEELFSQNEVTIALTPVLLDHRGSLEDWKSVLLPLLSQPSVFSKSGQLREGIYTRFMDDSDEWLNFRAKLVRSDFLAQDERHWSRGPTRKNHVSLG
eukprot:ANDGO_04986.mRNA.1 hypothetical protein GUITHDRAFT_135515